MPGSLSVHHMAPDFHFLAGGRRMILASKAYDEQKDRVRASLPLAVELSWSRVIERIIGFQIDRPWRTVNLLLPVPCVTDPPWKHTPREDSK